MMEHRQSSAATRVFHYELEGISCELHRGGGVVAEGCLVREFWWNEEAIGKLHRERETSGGRILCQQKGRRCMTTGKHRVIMEEYGKVCSARERRRCM